MQSGLDLGLSPWADLDGPSLAVSAAALQLLPENVGRLVRLQRLAAIGAALPARDAAVPLSPSRLRAILKDDAVSGPSVRRGEDVYDDIYVAEVLSWGGPRLVLQGLTSRSAHTAQLLLNAIFGGAGEGLPQPYVDAARALGTGLMLLSDRICRQAGLRRGMAGLRPPPSSVFVPGQERLGDLRGILTMSRSDLGSWMPQEAAEALSRVSVEAGSHNLHLSNASDDSLILTPLLIHEDVLIVSNPAEIAACLRHHFIVLAHEFNCVEVLAAAFRRIVVAVTLETLTAIDAWPQDSHENAVDPLVSLFSLSGPFSTRIDLAVVTDDLSDYDLSDPFGEWNPEDVGDRALLALKSLASNRSQDSQPLQLLITDGFARATTYMVPAEDDAAAFCTATLDDLRTLMDMQQSDPLFLWRFAEAHAAFTKRTQILTFSLLDVFLAYRDNEDSFYFGDDRPPNVIYLEPGSGVELRLEAARRTDRHSVLRPFSVKHAELIAFYGVETAPIYIMHPRHGQWAFAVELQSETVWVLATDVDDEAVERFLHSVIEAVAYWIWQIDIFSPGIFRGVLSRDGKLIVLVGVDGVQAWEDLLSGVTEPDSPEQAPPDGSPWARAELLDSGIMGLNLRVSPGMHLSPSSNEADREVVAAIVGAMLGGVLEDSSSQALISSVAPHGAKRMIAMSRASEVPRRRSSAATRLMQPAVVALLLDEMGAWFGSNGAVKGPVAFDERTDVLNKAVLFCFGRLTETLAAFEPASALLIFMRQDEALAHAAAEQAETLESRVACFGADSLPAARIAAEQSELALSSLSSRFLVEYVAACPPGGQRPLDILTYDYLIALASEIISRGTLSDAIRYNLSDVTISFLPSGRLGMSRMDKYSRGTVQFAESGARLRLSQSLQLTEVGSASEVDSVEPAALQDIDEAMVAEFGFSMTELFQLLGELISISDDRGEDISVAERQFVRGRLSTVFGWKKTKVEALLDGLSLGSRADFLGPGVDVYPWRMNRNLSYIRRPIIALPDGEHLQWAVRRVYLTGQHWTSLVSSGRMRASVDEMKRLMGSIRQAENEAFEVTVMDTLEQSGFPTVATGLAKIHGRRLKGPSQEDLGDIDAIGLDPRARIIVIAEAKDFELSRNPVELANEVNDLLVGAKSAAFKLGRRVNWVRSNLSEVMLHFGLGGSPNGWQVFGCIVTSQPLLSPLLVECDWPVCPVQELPRWVADLRRGGMRQRKAGSRRRR